MKKILILIALCIPALTVAEVKPIGPVEIVIPFTPGGGVDIVFKNLQGYAAKRDIRLISIYKPGAEGLIAANDILKEKTKANKLAIFPASTMGSVLFKDPSLEYHAITGLRTSIFGIAVRADSHIKNLDDLERKIKTGQDVSFAYGAPGHLNVIEQYIEFAKPPLNRLPLLVPYKGAAPAIIDVLGGQVDILAVPLVTIEQQVDSGKLRLLATIGDAKKYSGVPALPDVYKGWKQYEMFGVVANSGISKEEVVFWNQFLKSYLADPEVRESFERELTILVPFSPDGYNATVKENIKVLKQRENRK